MSESILLYDLPSKAPCRTWSGNAWKTRLALNFKGLPYTTEWVPYTRLQETIKATGVPPNPPGSWSEYSVPTVRLADGTYRMDSEVIAKELESLYPSPSLHLNPDLEKEASDAIGAVFVALIPFFAPIVVSDLVPTDEEEWFKTDRAQRFGMTVEELMAPKDPDAAYAGARPGFDKCKQVLTSHKKDEGPFILGSVPSYADFYLVSTMRMFSQTKAEVFARFLQEAGPELKDLYQACEAWTARQD